MPPGDEVKFENQGEEFGRPPQEKRSFDLAGKFVAWGLVPSRREGEYALIAIAAIAIIVAIFLFWSRSGGGGAPPPPPPNMAPGALPY